jgi:hypothetical protein
MSGHNHGGVPARLLRLKQRFVTWRKARKHGERIPQPLWKSAAKLAADYGVSQTATVLKLDYYSLKKRTNRQTGDTVSNSPFIELRSAPITHAGECVIEFEDGIGASMRVHLKGTEVPDVLALGRNFWDAG